MRHGRTKILANTHEVPVAESLKNPDASLKVDRLLDKLEFAAGADAVETFDAQTLAEDFLGDTIVANILALGFAWQRGLVPVSLEALTRAIELNDVAVPTNQLAFSLGRLAAADPKACEQLLGAGSEPEVAHTVEALVERAVEHLTGYQNAAWAARYRSTVDRARAAEAALGADPTLPFTRAVAQSLRKLMSYKDEYEVARLYTDGRFLADLDDALRRRPEARVPHGAAAGQPRRRTASRRAEVRFGPWMLGALKWLATRQGAARRCLRPVRHAPRSAAWSVN